MSDLKTGFQRIEAALKAANNWKKEKTFGLIDGVSIRRSVLTHQPIQGCITLVDHWGYAGTLVVNGQQLSIEFGGQYCVDGEPIDRP